MAISLPAADASAEAVLPLPPRTSLLSCPQEVSRWNVQRFHFGSAQLRPQEWNCFYDGGATCIVPLEEAAHDAAEWQHVGLQGQRRLQCRRLSVGKHEIRLLQECPEQRAEEERMTDDN